MVEFLNPIAELDNPDSGKIISPAKAYNLKDEREFFCPDYDCKDVERILTVKRSSQGNYFFCHRSNCTHDIRPETLLHKSAISWFKGKNDFEIPSHLFKNKLLDKQIIQIDSSKTELEFRKLKRIIPDVILHSPSGLILAIEIVVTNDISEKKKKLIDEFNLPTLRINLAEFYSLDPFRSRTDLEYIMANINVLLSDLSLKSWIRVPSELNGLNTSPIKKVIGWENLVLTGIAIVGLWKISKKK
jgi:hypothetical protein